MLSFQCYWGDIDISWSVCNSMGEGKREGGEAVRANGVSGKY